MEFKSTTEWDKQIKACKLTQRKGDKGPYFIGQLGKSITVTVHKNTHETYGKDKDGNQLWTMYFVPVTYKKTEEKANIDTVDLGNDSIDL